MKELVLEMLEKAKKDKGTLIALKSAAVKSQNYELASQLRQFEQEHFPESEEHTKAKAKGKELHTLLSMHRLNVDEGTAWMLHEIFAMYKKKGNKFGIKESVEILAKKHEIFGE